MVKSPVRALLWLFRVLALVMIVTAALSERSLFTKSNAIPALALVSTFFMEREMIRRFESKRDEPAGMPQQPTPPPSRLEEMYFAFVVGALRVIGGLFVLGAGTMGISILKDMENAEKGFGGPSGVAGAFVMLGFMFVLGILMVLGKHIPLMRGLRQLGAEWKGKNPFE